MRRHRGEQYREQQAVDIVVALGVGLVGYVVVLALGGLVEHFFDVRLGDVFMLGSSGVAFLVMLGFLFVTRRDARQPPT